MDAHTRIRLLLQLSFLLQQNKEFSTACSQLKIWPQKTGLYQMSLKRIDDPLLRHIVHYCQAIDEGIKTNSTLSVWNALEQVALSLCLGKNLCSA